jgi:hypothetical protein
MTRNVAATIRVMALAIAATLAFSIQIAAAESKAEPQGLWVADDQFNVEFEGKALKQSGEPSARTKFGSNNFHSPRSIAFDRHNNLWIAYSPKRNGPSALVEIIPSEVASIKNGKPAQPNVVIRGKSNDPNVFNAGNVAFDHAGDLWASDFARRLVEFLPNQIAHSSAPSPHITITTSDVFSQAMRFDASDNLWVATVLQQPLDTSQLLRFAPDDRAASGPANPGLMVNLPQGFIPMDLAFDNSGNLWMLSLFGQIEMISASDLGGSGEISLTPSVSVTVSAGGTGIDCGLGGIDFDHSGDLWVSVNPDSGECQEVAELVEFTPDQISAGGNLTPSVTIGQNLTATNLFVPGPIRFGPTIK